MSTYQSPGGSGWRGATYGCYRNGCTDRHRGWDIHATAGTDCRAAVAGTTTHRSQGNAGWGDYVDLTSTADANHVYRYAHLSARDAAGVVAEGDSIGQTGTTGNANATRPHLHFEVVQAGSQVDPGGEAFTDPTQVIEATGSVAAAFNAADPAPCVPCAM